MNIIFIIQYLSMSSNRRLQWNKFSAKKIIDKNNIPPNASLCQIHRLCEFDTDLQKVEFDDTEASVTLILNLLTHKCTPPDQATLFHSSGNIWHFTICENDDLFAIPLDKSCESGKFYTTTFVLPRFNNDTVRVKMDYNKYNSEGPANYLIFNWIEKKVYFECNYFKLYTQNIPNNVIQLYPKDLSVEEIISKNKDKISWFSNPLLVWHSDDPKIYDIAVKVASYINPKKPYIREYINVIDENTVLEIDI